MADQKYLNFDLAIERSGDHYRARVLQSCAGEGCVEFDLPFSEYELKYLLVQMGHRSNAGERYIHPFDSPELAAAKEFGTKLFGAVFQRDVYACLYASLNEARANEQRLRVLLRLPPELTSLPWEYLYNPDWNQFFSLSLDTPLVRYIELTPPLRSLAVQPPLRLLVAIASPSDYAPLDVEREWRDLQAALRPLVERGLVAVDRLENPILAALQSQLRQRQKYHIFHFIGHGQFSERQQDGRLVFCNEQGRGDLISGQTLGTLLHNHPSLRLALLNACEGARTAQNDPFAGVAHVLVQMGLPAVIAMQYAISDSAAVRFAREFYLALADGYEVDAALTEARTAVFAGQGSAEWGTPVLFTRVLDGRVFDLSITPSPSLSPQPTRPSGDFGSLVEPVHPPSERLPKSGSTPIPSPQPARLSDDFGSLAEPVPLPSDRLPKSGATPTPQDVTLTRLYEDGLSAFHLENWPRASECFQSVLQLRPDYRDAAEKLAQAQQQIDLAQRYQQAQDLLARSDWPGALAILEKLIAEAPAYRDASHHLQHARQQAHLQALYADATRQSQAGEWQAVIDSFAQIAKLQPDYPDPQNLLPQARQQLAAQQRAQKLAELYTNALHAMNNQRWSDVQRLLIPLVKMEPQYRDAPQLLEKARSEIARQRSSQGGARLLAWLSARRRGLAVAGLVLIGLGAVIFALTKLPFGMVPVGIPSATHSIPPSLTAELASVASPSHTLTLAPSVTPSLTATLTPSRTATITLTVTPTPSPGMVLIPAGSFQMGSDQGYDNEKPVHIVTLNAFLMDQYEVTNAKYAECVAAKKCSQPSNLSSYTRSDYYTNGQYASYPVLYVSWDDAKTYCEWRGGRLPSEAEWEKAARSGLEGKQYQWGDESPVCTLDAKNGAQFIACTPQDTIKVGSFKPNDYGLFDMAGNAWEWVSDWYSSSYYGVSPASNPPGPDATGNRYKVVRGGGGLNYFGLLRVATRSYSDPADHNFNIGFRCAATPGN